MTTKYKLFISHSSTEKNVAQAIRSVLGNAFKGDLSFFFSPEISVGSKWKLLIKEELSNCDAGLFIVTPEFQKSQWFIAEFTAFWLQDKDTFILTINDDKIDLNHFLSIMDDTQRGSVNNVESIKSLIAMLAKAVNKYEIPYEYAEEIKSFALAEYNKAQNTHAYKLFEEINNNNEYVQFRYTANDLMVLSDDQLAKVINVITNNEYLCFLLQKIVDKQRSNDLIYLGIRRLSDETEGDNDALGKFVKFLIRRRLFDKDFFNDAIKKIKNDTIMLRVLKSMYAVNPDMSKEYYFKKKNAYNEKLITNRTQRERMEKFFRNQGENIDELLKDSLLI